MFTHLISFLGIEEQLAVVVDDEIRPLLYVHFKRLHPGPFTVHAYYTETPYACIATPLNRDFSIIVCVAIANKAL